MAEGKIVTEQKLGTSSERSQAELDVQRVVDAFYYSVANSLKTLGLVRELESEGEARQFTVNLNKIDIKKPGNLPAPLNNQPSMADVPKAISTPKPGHRARGLHLRWFDQGRGWVQNIHIIPTAKDQSDREIPATFQHWTEDSSGKNLRHEVFDGRFRSSFTEDSWNREHKPLLDKVRAQLQGAASEAPEKVF